MLTYMAYTSSRISAYLPPSVQSAIVEHVKLSSGGHVKFDMDMSVWCCLIREGWLVTRSHCGVGYFIERGETHLFRSNLSCPCFDLVSMTTTVCKTNASSGMRTCPPIPVAGSDLRTQCMAVVIGDGIINIDIRMEVKPIHTDRADPRHGFGEYAEVLRGLAFQWVAGELGVKGVMIHTYPGLGPRIQLTSADAFNHGLELDRIVAFVAGVTRTSGTHAVPWHFAVLRALT